MKVKIFRNATGIGQDLGIEQEINQWLLNHKNIIITNILQSDNSVTIPNNPVLTISIFYNEPNQSMLG